MTFRDDHDAALARADALEVDAERARAKLREVQAERDRLRHEIDRLQNRPLRRPSEPPMPPPDAAPAKTRGAIAAVLVAGVMLGCIFVVITKAPRHSTQPVTEPQPSIDCELRSAPSGATVLAVQTMRVGLRDADIAVPIGETPLEKPRWAWSLYYNGLPGKAGSAFKIGTNEHIELDAAGYERLRIDDPCADITYRLVPVPQAAAVPGDQAQ